MNPAVLEVAESFASAELHGDRAVLDRELAPDFVGIGPLGFTMDKQQWLDRHSNGELKYRDFRLEDLELRDHGNFAIVIGRELMRGTYQGQDIKGLFRSLLLFIKENGRWLLAAHQLSPIPRAA